MDAIELDLGAYVSDPLIPLASISPQCTVLVGHPPGKRQPIAVVAAWPPHESFGWLGETGPDADIHSTVNAVPCLHAPIVAPHLGNPSTPYRILIQAGDLGGLRWLQAVKLLLGTRVQSLHGLVRFGAARTASATCDCQ